MSNDARQKEFKMRTIEKQIYTYAELTQKAQEKALANYNESEDYVQDTDSQVEILAMLGFIEAKVYCSGFYSQGDGSCFEGVWYPENMDIDKIKLIAITDSLAMESRNILIDFISYVLGYEVKSLKVLEQVRKLCI